MTQKPNTLSHTHTLIQCTNAGQTPEPEYTHNLSEHTATVIPVNINKRIAVTSKLSAAH